MSFLKTVKKSLVYHNQWIKVYEHEVQRRSGKGIYSIVERADSVVILPMSPSGRTVLLMQYRYPTGEISWELPMGGVGSHESVEDAASRELLEETSLRSKSFQKMGSYYPVPGLTQQRATVFLARVTEDDLSAVNIPVSEEEIGGYQIVTLSDVSKRVSSGDITDGFTITGLFFLQSFLEQPENGLLAPL